MGKRPPDIHPDVAGDNVGLLADRLSCCFDSKRQKPKKIRVRAATYHPKNGVLFAGIQFCPARSGTKLALDIQAALQEFDAVDSCEFSSYQVTKAGTRFVPHIRIMGRFRGIIVMVDVYVQLVTLEE